MIEIQKIDNDDRTVEYVTALQHSGNFSPDEIVAIMDYRKLGNDISVLKHERFVIKHKFLRLGLGEYWGISLINPHEVADFLSIYDMDR